MHRKPLIKIITYNYIMISKYNNIILIIISVIIYYPFFKMYDNELLAEEKSKEAVSA